MPRAKRTPKVEEENTPTGANVVNRPYACEDNAEWGGFLNLRIDDDMKDDFHEWFLSPDAEEHWGLLDAALLKGIKVSVVYDAKNDAYITTFTGSLLQDGKRQAMVSRAGTWQQSIMLQVYKHHVILEGDYSSTRQERNGWNRFG